MKIVAFIYMLFSLMPNMLHAQKISIQELPSIPDDTGFAGSFAGIIDGKLIVAGGSNFPDGGAPWKGSAKVWYDAVFVLENKHANWKKIGALPHPAAYGVSISVPQGLICIGGSSKQQHYADVFLFNIKNNKLHTRALSPLPVPLANMCGALAGDIIYVAGGTTKPDADTTESLFFAMDISHGIDEAQWKQLPSWPGQSRMLAVCATVKNSFYLFSGAALQSGVRNYLKDAYQYSPSKGWTRLHDLPEPVVAAATPAFHQNNFIHIAGGDDGSNASKNLQLQHPGFSSSVLQYNIIKNDWEKVADLKKIKKNRFIPVTTSSVFWKGRWILPGGEIKPGVRTPKVFSLHLK